MPSTASNRNFTRNQLSTDYDFSKVFRFANSYIKANYTNADDEEVTLRIGTVMGRISGNGNVVPLSAGASDGSQFPIGILAEDVVVGPTASVPDLAMVNGGDVAEGALILPDGTTLDSVISDKRLRDRLVSDTKGLRLVPVSQNTSFNNF